MINSYEYNKEYFDLSYKISKFSFDVLKNRKYDESINHRQFWVIHHSIDEIFFSIVQLYSTAQFISGTVLIRSMIEAMSIANWLISDLSDYDSTKLKFDILINNTNRLVEITKGKHVLINIPGDRKGRIKKCGGQWYINYKHLSSFVHLDTAYSVHYYNQETHIIMRHYLVISTIALLNTIKFRHEYSNMLKPKDLKKIENYTNKLNKYLALDPENKVDDYFMV